MTYGYAPRSSAARPSSRQIVRLFTQNPESAFEPRTDENNCACSAPHGKGPEGRVRPASARGDGHTFDLVWPIQFAHPLQERRI